MLDAEVIDDFILGFDEGSLGDTRIYVGTVGHTWTLSPTLVLDGNFGINRHGADGHRPRLRHNSAPTATASPARTAATSATSGIPFFDTGAGLRNDYFGTTPNWMPLFRTEQSFTFSSALTKVMTKHELRFGIDVVKHELNHYQAEFGSIGGVRGRFTFATRSPGRRATSRRVELVRRLPARPAVDAGKDVQEIQMTGREWQMAAFIRDRWQVGQKLTLSLGLRFEYYPLMTRADGKGIERLDYSTYEVLLGGYGTTPKDVGINIRASTSRRASVPCTGSPTRRCCAPATAAPSTRCRGRARCAAPTRTTSPTTGRRSSTASSARSRPGIPPVPVPDLSSGAREAAAQHVHALAEPRPTSDRAVLQQANVAVEQRLPLDISLRWPTSTGARTAAMPTATSTTASPAAVRRPAQFFAVAGTTDISDWARRTKRRYNALQIALNRPYKNGLLLKGAYTLSKAKNETDEDGWASLPVEPPLEARRQLRPVRRRPHARAPDGLPLRAAVRQGLEGHPRRRS